MGSRVPRIDCVIPIDPVTMLFIHAVEPKPVETINPDEDWNSLRPPISIS